MLLERATSRDRIVLYVHIPFCAKICSYCLLSAQRPEGKGALTSYADALVAEIRRHGEMFDGLPLSALHVGGGTPTLLSIGDLDRVLSEAERAFARTPDFVGDVEAHPATATPDKLALLRQRGVGRVSFGVETFTPKVLELANREDQTRERVLSAVSNAKAEGLLVNVDLLAGLPGETLESFEESLRHAIELDVDALSINRYLAEGSPLGSLGFSPDPEEVALATDMLERADLWIRKLRPPAFPPPSPQASRWGIQYSYRREGDRRSYSQQDMIDPGSVLAIGHGAMGRVHAGYHYIADRDVQSFTRSVLGGDEPDILAARTDLKFEMAFFVADHACRDGVDSEEFRRVFRRELGSVFEPELSFLVGEALLTPSYRKPPRRDFDAAHLIAFLADRSGARQTDSEPELVRQSALDAARAYRELARRPGPSREQDRAFTHEYSQIDSELPPSLLWCRLAMRAARAARKRLLQ